MCEMIPHSSFNICFKCWKIIYDVVLGMSIFGNIDSFFQNDSVVSLILNDFSVDDDVEFLGRSYSCF